MAVKHLYRHVKTDRPAELVAHLSARPASPFISSKRENVGSIRRLQLEYPALHAQPTYMELLRDQDDFEWSQVGHVNPRHMAETAHYVARYLRYVGRLLHFYSIVEKHPAQRLMRLDTLTLGHQTMFSGGDWTMQSTVMQKVQPATTGARRLIELTGVKHYCQQTDDGCLGLTSDLIVTAEQKKHLKSVRIHLTDMNAPPPFIWASPVSWSYDADKYAHNDNGLKQGRNNIANGIIQAVSVPLHFRDQGMQPGGGGISRAPVNHRTLKKLDLTVYATPAVSCEVRLRNMVSLGKQDSFSWRPASVAPKCPACDWEPRSVTVGGL